MGTPPRSAENPDDYQVSLAAGGQWFVMARPEVFARQELGDWLRKRPFTELVRDSADGFLVTMKPRSRRTPTAYAGVIRAELKRRYDAWVESQPEVDPPAELQYLEVKADGKSVLVTALDDRIDLPTLTVWLRAFDDQGSVHVDGDIDSRTLRVLVSFHLTAEEFAADITQRLAEKEAEAEGQPPFQRRRVPIGELPADGGIPLQYCRVYTVGGQIHVTFDPEVIDAEALRSNLADLDSVDEAHLKDSNVVVIPDQMYGLEWVENTIVRELPSIEPHVLLQPELPRVDGRAAQRLLEHLGLPPDPAARARVMDDLMSYILRYGKAGPAMQAFADGIVDAVLDRMGPGEELDAVVERLSMALMRLQTFAGNGFTITITRKGKIKVKVAPARAT